MSAAYTMLPVDDDPLLVTVLACLLLPVLLAVLLFWPSIRRGIDTWKEHQKQRRNRRGIA